MNFIRIYTNETPTKQQRNTNKHQRKDTNNKENKANKDNKVNNRKFRTK